MLIDGHAKLALLELQRDFLKGKVAISVLTFMYDYIFCP